MTSDKKRVNLTLTKIYRDALELLVEEGIYLTTQEAMRDALRMLFEAQGIPPFYSQEAELSECPQCSGPATHPSGLCRDCHQAKLEAGPP